MELKSGGTNERIRGGDVPYLDPEVSRTVEKPKRGVGKVQRTASETTHAVGREERTESIIGCLRQRKMHANNSRAGWERPVFQGLNATGTIKKPVPRSALDEPVAGEVVDDTVDRFSLL